MLAEAKSELYLNKIVDSNVTSQKQKEKHPRGRIAERLWGEPLRYHKS
jgi:hypothetical protein